MLAGLVRRCGCLRHQDHKKKKREGRTPVLCSRMSEGPRKRSSTGGGGEAERPDAAKAAGAGVALKKQIGLVSACGIIIGKWVRVGFVGGSRG